MWRLERYVHALMGDHDDNATGRYLFSPQLIELYGTRGGSEATLSQEAGARAMGHVAAPELPCVRRWELAPRATW
jgi:hypothetical protein